MKLNAKLALLAIPLLLAGCFSGGGSNSDTLSLSMDTSKAVAIAANSPDFATSDVLLINQLAIGGADLIQGELATTNPSDISVASNSNSLYRLNRSQADSITHYNIGTDGTFNLDWEYSVADSDGESGNPYTVVQATENKAFIIRYDSTEIWVANPNANIQDEFKLETIDLEAFKPSDDSAPNMTAALIHDGILYVLLERLNGFSPEENSFLVAFDVDSYEEVALGNTNKGEGLDLGVRNATGMSLNENDLYIVGRGDTGFGGTGEGEGGIVRVPLNEPSQNELLIDDGDAGNRPWGQMVGLSVIDDQNGYFIGSEGWQDDRLYHFNPSVGETSIQAVSGTGGGGLGGLLHVTNTQTWSAPDLLFVGRSAVEDGRSAGVMVIDVTTSPQAVESVIETDFNPSALTLIQH